MANTSLLPPMKNNGGKYALLGLLLLGGAAALWYFVLREEPKASEPIKVEQVQRAPVYEEILELPPAEPDASVEEAPQPEKKRAFKRRECKGSLSASEIRRAIDGGPRKQVRACYERQLKGNNNLQGLMNVELTIIGTGRVAGVRIDGSLKSSAVSSCVKTVARQWRFPEPSNGCVRTVVPFNLSPKR